ncbi:MAG: DUF4349 domain-containing protein, partial [Chloroflexi bacterium]|nr:DUF4349 domain-containing protein [Chloroflexota bacterium]
MTARRTWISPLGIFLILGIAVACGGGLDAITEPAAAGAPGAPGRPGLQRTTVVETVVVERVVTQGRVAATPAPALLRAEGGFDTTFTEGASSLSTALDREVAAVAAQQRIIVRTVSMELQVDDVTLAIEAISSISESLGGWVVSSERSAQHRGSISVRVPAERLDEVLTDFRALAAKVESESATSQDFTDEYTDTAARVRALEATVAALLKLFERADKVEDAIRVQTELTNVQADIERLKGRLTLLEQTSAFSLVSVDLRAVPIEMVVDAGPDLTLAVGRSTRFRVSFRPPEGIEDFEVVWDFGDGIQPVTVFRTAPTLEEGMLIAAPVSHVYGDDTDSPFTVTVEITGSGEA